MSGPPKPTPTRLAALMVTINHAIKQADRMLYGNVRVTDAHKLNVVRAARDDLRGAREELAMITEDTADHE